MEPRDHTRTRTMQLGKQVQHSASRDHGKGTGGTSLQHAQHGVVGVPGGHCREHCQGTHELPRRATRGNGRGTLGRCGDLDERIVDGAGDDQGGLVGPHRGHTRLHASLVHHQVNMRTGVRRTGTRREQSDEVHRGKAVLLQGAHAHRIAQQGSKPLNTTGGNITRETGSGGVRTFGGSNCMGRLQGMMGPGCSAACSAACSFVEGWGGCSDIHGLRSKRARSHAPSVQPGTKCYP